MTEVSATTRVARDLTEILDLSLQLSIQAIHRAGAIIDGASLPGGEAMVALAPVAEREINERRVELREREHLATCQRLEHTRCWTGAEDEDDSEPILQTLLFWSEAWRSEHGYPLEGRRPTVASEANVIRALIDWAWDNLPEWDDFAADISRARVRLENLLEAGKRNERGAPCLICNTELIRPVIDRRRKLDAEHEGDCYDNCVHDQGGRRDEWHCPKCDLKWDAATYSQQVAEVAKTIAEWLPLEAAMERTGATRTAIWKAASRGTVRKKKDVNTGRVTYSVADIEARVTREEAIA